MSATINPGIIKLREQVQSMKEEMRTSDPTAAKTKSAIQGEISSLLQDKTLGADDQARLKAAAIAIGRSMPQGQNMGIDASTTSEASFEQIEAMLDGMGGSQATQLGVKGQGFGTAFKNLNGADAKAAGIPANVAALQSAGNKTGPQQVNRFYDGKGEAVYITSGNNDAASKYDIFDKNGKPMGSIAAPGALGLNDGQTWLALGPGGVATSTATAKLGDLSQNTALWDLNGAAEAGGKIVNRGLNAGGASKTSGTASSLGQIKEYEK